MAPSSAASSVLSKTPASSLSGSPVPAKSAALPMPIRRASTETAVVAPTGVTSSVCFVSAKLPLAQTKSESFSASVPATSMSTVSAMEIPKSAPPPAAALSQSSLVRLDDLFRLTLPFESVAVTLGSTTCSG
jgi:hypothetical protein